MKGAWRKGRGVGGAIVMIGWLASLAWGQPRVRGGAPTAGYIYPAGAPQGATIQAMVGGQYLRRVTAVHITGDGVQARATDYGPALSPKQLRDVGRTLMQLIRQRWREQQGWGGRMPPKAEEKKAAEEPLPDHPWLRDLERASLQKLEALRRRLFDPKRQPNAQLSELVFLEIKIAPAAAPGVRELRLETAEGLSNPVRFIVGEKGAEVVEDIWELDTAPAKPLSVPIVCNGQILPGDTDTYRFEVRRGQRLVITAEARHLVPYLADAVPGWFQAVLTLYDAQGKRLAYADDYRFDPDPVLYFEPPADGIYAVEIRDALYRGREDFVYRLTIAERPFITRWFPLGGAAGQPLSLELTGWNLPAKILSVDTAPQGPPIRQAFCSGPNGRSNSIYYAVSDLPEIMEGEPNDPTHPQALRWPVVVNGRIEKRGEIDAFSFEGQAGETVVLETQARRLGSPIDTFVRLCDGAGRLLGFNDDQPDPRCGWLTHTADSYLAARLAKKGKYIVQVGDVQGHGGPEYAYRLYIRRPRPDFSLSVSPSGLKLGAGKTALLEVHAFRQDGFEGPVELALGGFSAGFALSGGRIPAGYDVAHITITAPREPPRGPVALQIVGKAQIGREVVTRTATPVEEMMQAFAYQHLVPTEQFLLAVAPEWRWTPYIELKTQPPLRLPVGGTVQLEFAGPVAPQMRDNLRLALKYAPPGVLLKTQEKSQTGLRVTLEAAKDLKPGPADNVIFEAFMSLQFKRENGKTQTIQAPVGILPAIPLEIVAGS